MQGEKSSLMGWRFQRLRSFKYLGSIIHQKGDIDEDIYQRIKVVGKNESML